MKQKLAAIISLIALTFIMTLASCAPISDGAGEDSSQITIKLPPIVSYSIRALTTEQVSRLQRETAKYRVTFSGAGQTITREGDGTTFSATFPTGAQVGVTVYCLNTKGEVIVKTVTKNITISSGANSLSFKLSEDGEEIEVNQEDPPNTDTPGDGDTPTTPPTTDTPGGSTPGGDNPPTPQPALYSITYNWGSVTPTSGALPNAQNNITSGTSATIDIPTIQADYTFLGWSETEGAASATYKTGANTIQSVTKDYTLYAVWVRTVLYDDGTLIINELPANRKTNVNVTQTYEAMKDDGSNYMFSWERYVLWYDNRASVTSVEIGSDISPTGTAYWFYQMSNCISMNLTNLDTSNVTNMSSMFSNCDVVTNLDVSNFDTSKVTDMSGMFAGNRGLTSLDVSNFDTSKVTDMSRMFNACPGLTSLDVSNFDTSKVTNMSAMFKNCSGLPSLDLRNFDTSSVTNMVQMFEQCTKLTSLDLSNFDTSSVTNMTSMFGECSTLATIYVSSRFITDNLNNNNSIFYKSSALVGGQNTPYDPSNIGKDYARIDNPPNAPGYFTDIADKP